MVIQGEASKDRRKKMFGRCQSGSLRKLDWKEEEKKKKIWKKIMRKVEI